jgi:hypothetical protein
MSAEQSLDAGQPPASPVITVTRGRATDAELAAVVVVLLGTRPPHAPGPTVVAARPSLWAASLRGQSALSRPGPHSWRASALPH